jgi:hypothetical protein
MKLLACLTALMLLASPVAAADFDKSYVPPALSGTASSTVVSLESPEGVVYCGGKGITRMIEYTTPTKPSQQNQWNVRVTIVETNVRTKTRTERQTRAMTGSRCSFFSMATSGGWNTETIGMTNATR